MIQLLVLAGIIIAALLAVSSKDLLLGVIFLAAMSILVSIEFYFLQAPDVAITEAAVGAGLSTAIFIVAIWKTRRNEQ